MEPIVKVGISGKHLEALPHPILPTSTFRSSPLTPLPDSVPLQHSVANIYTADYRQQASVLTRKKQTQPYFSEDESHEATYLVIYFLGFLGVVLAPPRGLRTT